MSELRTALENCSAETAVHFIAPIQYGKVCKVYDGDTITILSKLPYDGSPLYKFSVRLNGIDTPEIKGKTAAEKELAKKARDALCGLINGKVVELRNLCTEKYGRILADVYIGDIHVNEWMIEQKHAVKYDGGTKQRPEEWDEC